MRHDNNNKNENRDDNRCVNRGVSRGMSLASDNRGIGVVEIVLILVVLVALVIIFKDKIIEIINKAFESITSGTDSL
jgi:predicted metalloprotease